MSEHPHPSPDLHITRDELQPHVRSYDKNLDAQAREIFLRNHLPAYNQEALEKAARTGAINVTDLTKLRDLLKQRDHMRRTGQLPPEAKEALGIITIHDAINPYREALLEGEVTDLELTQEHRDITLNLPELIRQHALLYEEAHLPSWAEALRNHTPYLTPESLDLLFTEIKNGAIPILMPGRRTQRTTIKQALQNLKPLWIKDHEPQTFEDAYIWDEYYDNLIATSLDALLANIPEEPYLLLTKPTQAPPPETTNMTLEEQRAWLATQQQTNPHLSSILPQEYASLQALFTRILVETTSHHPLTTLDPLDRDTWTRFISLPVSDDEVLCGSWSGDESHQMWFDGFNVKWSEEEFGLRSAVRVKL